jgi:hypothetical protein
MNSPGRPHVLDDSHCAEICELVAAGHSVAAVARLVGCNVKTIRRHAQRDETFACQLRAAEVNARNDPLKQLRRAASSNWRAAAWLLERSDPERFGKQTGAACRPEDVDRTFTRIMETVLEQLEGDQARRTMYNCLARVMEEESLHLFLPPAARPKNRRRPITPLVDDQRLYDMFATPSPAAPTAISGPWGTRAPIDPPKTQSTPSPPNLESFPPSGS